MDSLTAQHAAPCCSLLPRSIESKVQVMGSAHGRMQVQHTGPHKAFGLAATRAQAPPVHAGAHIADTHAYAEAHEVHAEAHAEAHGVGHETHAEAHERHPAAHGEGHAVAWGFLVLSGVKCVY